MMKGNETIANIRFTRATLREECQWRNTCPCAKVTPTPRPQGDRHGKTRKEKIQDDEEVCSSDGETEGRGKIRKARKEEGNPKKGGVSSNRSFKPQSISRCNAKPDG